MKNIFVYGSLMFESVWNRVVTGSYQKIEGQLFGYSRFCIKGEHYPGLIEKPGTVDGVIWLDVNQEDIAKLDCFEGDYYGRSQVFVADSHDRCLDCETYVIADNFQYLLDEKPWDVDQFHERYLEDFIAEYVGFKATEK
ncbi:MAG: gamma-glutamylcyclotransferase [Gammaproteobacteria bacterium]|nr:gamma-glutamylcyclotransferase [Gammaproteobacteria bacterium]